MLKCGAAAFALLFVNLVAAQAPPFEPVAPTGLPYSIVISGVTIDGQQLPTGAQIGVFDDTLCVGAVWYDQDSANTQLVAWEGDDSQGLPGFEFGNTMLFKVRVEWFSQIQVFDATATYQQGNGTFGFGGFSVVNLDVNTGLAPDISVSETILDFGDVPTGGNTSLGLDISNLGNIGLEVWQIVSSSSSFTLSDDSLTISDGGMQSVTVTFAPTAEIAYNEVLTIVSNSPGEDTVLVNLTGNGITAVGIDEPATATEMNIFPNPTPGTFNIEMKGVANELVNVRLVNAAGTTVWQQKVRAESDRMMIDLPKTVVEGTYWIEIFVSDKVKATHSVTIVK